MEFFFGVFDNDKDRELPNLAIERKNIEDALFNFDKDGEEEMRLEIRYNLGVAEFKRSLDKYAGRMTIFHFSGHHDKGTIQLTDQKINNLGLIEILNNSPRLKLVFLNGCATKAIANQLTNVPIVIATERAIGDIQATELSSSFYKKLSNNIQNFRDPQKIKAFLEAAFGGVKLTTNISSETPISPKRGGGDTNNIDTNYRINIHDTLQNFEEKVKYNINIEDYPTSENCQRHINSWFKDIKIPERKFHQEYYYKYFPRNLYILLQDLTPNPDTIEDFKINQTRFSQIKDLYNSLLLFFRHCGYSLIWDLLTKNPNCISASTKEKIRNELDLSWLHSPPNDHENLENRLILLNEIYYILTNHSSKPIGEIIEKNKTFIYYVTTFLYDNHHQLISFCRCFSASFQKNKKHNRFLLQAEEFLHFFIKNCGFLSYYELASVYGSTYYNYRTGDKDYEYKVRYFPDEKFRDTKTEKGDDTKYEVYSVILKSSNSKNDNTYINLSPFYIDLNIGKESADQIDLRCLTIYDNDGGIAYKQIIDQKEEESSPNKEKSYQNDKVKVDKHLKDLILKLA